MCRMYRRRSVSERVAGTTGTGIRANHRDLTITIVLPPCGHATDDASIPVSLVQDLWSRWKESPPDVRDAVTAVIGELMRSPRWHWDVTVLPDQSLPDPQDSLVSSRDGRWTSACRSPCCGISGDGC